MLGTGLRDRKLRLSHKIGLLVKTCHNSVEFGGIGHTPDSYRCRHEQQ